MNSERCLQTQSGRFGNKTALFFKKCATKFLVRKLSVAKL